MFSGDCICITKKSFYKDVIYFRYKGNWSYTRKGEYIRVTWIVEKDLNTKYKKENRVSYITILNLLITKS